MSVRLSVRPSVRPSVSRPSVRRFRFPDHNLSKHRWIFTKVGMCIDIVEIWFGIANAQRQMFTELCARDTIMAGYYSLTFLFIGIVQFQSKVCQAMDLVSKKVSR